MTLQATPPISTSDIATEFGDSLPIDLRDYLGAAPGLPASGDISMLDFLGVSAVTILVTSRTVSHSVGAGNEATAGWEAGSGGQARKKEGVTFTNLAGEWMDPTGAVPGSDYDVRATVQSGPSLAAGSDAVGTWLSLGATRLWQQQAQSISYELRTTQLLVEVRDASTLSVVESGTITLQAESGTA